MTVFTSDTCSKYELDENLPQEFKAHAGNTCLSCKHSIKCTHDGDVDIMPCGNPILKQQVTIVPK